jgi:uncharacterized membrane protein (UPF0127 family)
MKASILRNGNILSVNVVLANRLLERLKGLLGRKMLHEGESLWIRPCKSIHTIGMKFPIDAVFLDKQNVVINFKKTLLPNRITLIYINAVSVLELPAGTLTATDTRVGDKIEIA